MKKFLFLLLISSSIVSCKSDDDSSYTSQSCQKSSTTYFFSDHQKLEWIVNQNRLIQSAGNAYVFEIKTLPATCPPHQNEMESNLDKNIYRIIFQIPRESNQVNWTGDEVLQNATPILEVSNQNTKNYYLMDEPTNKIEATKKGNKWEISYILSYKSVGFEYQHEGINQSFSIAK